MSEQQDFRITTTIRDVFDIPKAGVVLTMHVDLSIWERLPEDWQPSLLMHDGISYRVGLIDKFRVVISVPGTRTIGISIGHAAPRSRFKYGDAIELR